MMFYEACIIEGQKITNSKEFAQTLNSLLTE
jgi:HSP90 family molecular chaperone